MTHDTDTQVVTTDKSDPATPTTSPASLGSPFVHSMHKLGRIGMLGAIVVFFGMPTLLGLYFGLPSLSELAQGSWQLLLIFVPITISEMIAYTPILGSAMYLSTITGEILNIKLPVATNAMKQTNVEPGTEKADIVATLSVCVAAFVTLIVVSLGVVLMIPLQPVLETAAVQTAVNNILPALFGALGIGLLGSSLGGGARAPKRLLGTLVALPILVALAALDRFVILPLVGQSLLSSFAGVFILFFLPVVYFFTRWLYRRGTIKVILPEDEEEDE